MNLQQRDNGCCELILQNVVDYSSGFPDKLPEGTKKILIDCAKVSYISSAGIFQWVRWINSIQSSIPGLQIEFTNLVAPFIKAQEMSGEIMPESAIVSSFFYDYFCPSCRVSKQILVENSGSKSNSAEQCAKCNSPMELELPDQTYDLIRNRAPVKGTPQ